MNFLLKLWFFLPAAAGNAAPVLLGHPLLRRLPNAPVDLGLQLPDGHRLFGDGKTFLGFLVGTAAGTAVGALQGSALLGAALSFGALLGDLAGSFLKRRLGMKRGEALLFVDQLDLVAGAVVLSWPLGVFGWSAPELLLLAVLALPIHRLSCMFGHRTGIKREPW